MNPGSSCVGSLGAHPNHGGRLKQTILMMLSFVAALVTSCSWQPPEPAMVIAGEEIPWAELSCPDRLSESSEQCREIERLKTRRLIFDRMLDQAITESGVVVGDDVSRQVDSLASRMEPSFRRHAEIMRCHAIAALQAMGDPVDDDPGCAPVDQGQVDQLVGNLSRRELRELVEDDLVAKMSAAQKTNLRAEATLGLVRDHLEGTGRDEEEFWSEIYDSLDPLFFDARLAMGPAEVITGNPAGWRHQQGS